jgi:hypothetical protein
MLNTIKNERRIYPRFIRGNTCFVMERVQFDASMSYALGYMRVRNRLIAVTVCAAVSTFGQDAKPTTAAKATKSAKTKKSISPVTFEAHNEGSIEGNIYGSENLVSVTIDSAGITYQGKGMDKPFSMPWAQIAGWQANNFTSRNPSRAGGDFGIGIYLGARYFSFRTQNGRDFTAAVKELRALAYAKERAGIG